MNDQTATQIDAIAQALKELTQKQSSQDIVINDLRFLEFRAKSAEDNYGKGLIFTGKGYTKQLIFGGNPERFFSSENIDLARNRHLSIDNVKVLTESELGESVTKSNLQELGRLKGLVIDGSMVINGYLHYNAASDRLGIGTESPNAVFSVMEDSIEVMLGTTNAGNGLVGTYSSIGLDIVTDNTARISISGNGNIDLGNPNKPAIQTRVHGKLSVGVATPDPAVDLHVAGPVRLNNHIQMYASEPPISGSYTAGDIIWNSNPTVGRFVGWVCLRAGSPGSWYPFGEIKERG